MPVFDERMSWELSEIWSAWQSYIVIVLLFSVSDNGDSWLWTIKPCAPEILFYKQHYSSETDADVTIRLRRWFRKNVTSPNENCDTLATRAVNDACIRLDWLNGLLCIDISQLMLYSTVVVYVISCLVRKNNYLYVTLWNFPSISFSMGIRSTPLEEVRRLPMVGVGSCWTKVHYDDEFQQKRNRNRNGRCV